MVLYKTVMGSYLLPRFFAYDTKRFQRSLRVYAGAIIGLAAVGFLMLRTSARYLPVVYILMLGAVMALALMLAGPVPHLRTRHCVTGESVILRHGLGFRLTIPFSNIALIKEKETSSKPGTRVDRAEGTLYVIASGKGSVKIGLRETMAVSGGAFDTVILDVEDPTELVSSVKERRKGEALMRKFDDGPRRKEPVKVPEAEEEPIEGEIVEDEPTKRPPQKQRSARMQKASRAPAEEPPARIVRIPKGRDD